MKTLRDAVEEWLTQNELYGDTTLYSRREWEDRGEPHGHTAHLTITAEGSNSLNRVYNYPSPGDGILLHKFDALAASYGYYVSMGFSWSWHFYPIHSEPVRLEREYWREKFGEG